MQGGGDYCLLSLLPHSFNSVSSFSCMHSEAVPEKAHSCCSSDHPWEYRGGSRADDDEYGVCSDRIPK